MAKTLYEPHDPVPIRHTGPALAVGPLEEPGEPLQSAWHGERPKTWADGTYDTDD